MKCSSTDTAYAAVRAAEPASMSRDDSEVLLGEVRRLRSWLDSVEMATVRRLRELRDQGRSEDPESLIADVGGCSDRDAEAVGDRADLCDEAPTLGDAVDDGELTAAHLDAINAAAKNLPPDVRAEFMSHADELLGRARQLRLDRFRRECRQLAKHLLAQSRQGSDVDELEEQRKASKLTRWVDQQTGMHHTHLELDPIRDAKLAAAFNSELARLRATDGSGNDRTPWAQLQVDAFLNGVAGIASPANDRNSSLIDSDSGGTATDAGAVAGRVVDRVPEITVLVDHQYLFGLADSGVCETDIGVPVPVSTVRRLCCDAEVLPAVLGGTGEVLDLGRSKRTASAAQRRALRAMYRGCVHPQCSVGFDACRIHHVLWWGRHLGPTDLCNLLPLCEKHHHLVHEGGWNLTLDHDPQRVATWTRPDGSLHHRGPTIDRNPGPESR